MLSYKISAVEAKTCQGYLFGECSCVTSCCVLSLTFDLAVVILTFKSCLGYL